METVPPHLEIMKRLEPDRYAEWEKGTKFSQFIDRWGRCPLASSRATSSVR